MKNKFSIAMSLALIMSMLFTSVGLADNVQNDVVAGGNDTITAGGSTTINYRITANNGDGQTGCNAADSSAAVITINTPAGVTVDTSGAPGNQVTLTFTSCGTSQSAIFSSSTAGNYPISVSVSDSGTGSYNTSPASFTLHVSAPVKTTPTITWANPADITFGTPLSGTQLNATTSAPGTFVYTPADGTVLNVGSGQILHVDFTPSDTTAYNNASKDVAINVLQASSTVTVNCPVSVTYNGSAQTPCSATATGAGGLNQALTVNYTNNTAVGTATASASYGGDANHTGNSGSVNFEISKAPVTATAGSGSSTYDGSLKSPAACTVSGAYTGDLGCTNDPASVGPDAGTYAIAPVVSGTGVGNFEIALVNGSYTIDQASSTVTVTCNAGPFTYSGAAIEPCTATVTGAGGLDQVLPVTYSNNVDAGLATASASFAGDANHTASNGSANFTIDQAPSVTTVSCPSNVTYTGSALEPCTAAVTGAGALNQPLTVSYANNTDAGTATASANYAGDANHLGSSDTETFTIDQAPSETTLTCPSNVTYTGSALEPCTATVTGAGSLNQAVAVTYSNNVDAGTATANANYAGDTNHLGSSDTETFTIDQAPSETTLTCPSNVTYTGSALEPCTATVTGAGSLNQAVVVTYSNNVDAGTATANANYAGDTNHLSSSDTETFTIDQAPSVTTVSCPASVTYNGTAQTPCTAIVTGAGGLSQSLTVTYTNNTNAGNATASASYAGDANHLGSSDSKTFTINKANAACTVTGYSVYYDGNSHTATGSCVGVLNETLSGLDLSGTTHVLVGTYTDTWTFNDSTGNYNNASGTVNDAILAWALNGFYQPVDMGNVWNTVKNGSTVPLKFEIFAGSTELTSTASVKSITSALVACTAGNEDAIETLVTATGGTALRYDATSGQFIFNWKTPSTAGKCYRVTMEALDGSKLIALFKLK